MVRRLASLMLAMMLLAACGGTPAAEVPTTAAEPTVAATEPTIAPTIEAATAESTPVPDAGPSTTSTTAATEEPDTTAGAEATTATAGAEATTAASTDGTASYPVSIPHKYGATEISGRPERIVAVGLTDQDPLLALGVTPVGVTEWFGNQPYAAWPWARDLLGEPKPVVLSGQSGIDYENITALKPDLIVALYSGLKQEEYDLLSQIAPTVAQPGDAVDYGIAWQDQTRTIGRILGESAKAEELIRGVEDKIAAVRAEHPEFAGKTSVVATPYEGIWVYGEQDVRGRFLRSLGFQLPADLGSITGTSFGGNLSEERADLLDVDVIIWLDADQAKGPLGGPVYASLPVHTEGREVFLASYTDPLGAATSFVTVLSLPFLLDGIVPRLAQAIDGDPNTIVATSVPAEATAAPPTESTAEATTTP